MILLDENEREIVMMILLFCTNRQAVKLFAAWERERGREEREKRERGGEERERGEYILTLQASSKSFPGTCDSILLTISTGKSETKSQY